MNMNVQFRICCLTCIAVLIANFVACSHETGPSPGWPGIYGPNQDSVSPERGLVTRWGHAGPPIKWERPAGTGYSTPISTGNQVFVMFRVGDEEVLECLNAETGELNWEYRHPTTFKCGWESYSSGPYSTPVVNDSHIFFASTQGKIFCLARVNGELAWSRDLFAEFELKDQKWPVVTSPAITNDRLIFNLGAGEKSAGIIALSLKDGTTIWQASDDSASHTTPLIAEFHGRTLAFVLTAQALVCLDPGNGKILWEVSHEMNVADDMFGNAVTPVRIADKIVIVSGPNVRPGFRCFQIKRDFRYEEPWSNIRLLNTQYTNLIVQDKFLYGMKGSGSEMRCIDMENGELAWKSSLEIGRANAIAVGNSMLLFGERGHLASIELNSRELVLKSSTAKPVLEPPCFTPMALNNGLLYLRNDTKLVCLSLRGTN